MSYSENGNAAFTMPVAPYSGNGNGNGFFGNDGAWWLIILLLFANNGWGNGSYGNGSYCGDPYYGPMSMNGRGYSRHSISDRAVEKLEHLMDAAGSDYERQELKRYIGMIRQAGMTD